MQINTNGKRNITLDFDAPRKFKLKKDGAEIPYIRTGANSFRIGRNIDGVLDLEEVIEQPRIVKPMQLKAQQMALVNPNDVLMINQAAQQLEVEQNILSETQKRVEQTQAYLDIQQQRINESVLSVQGLETDNADRITANENGIFNLAGEIAKAVQNSADIDNYIISELDEHKTAENPHGITKETIGLDKVDNTSDLDKPISKAVQGALDEKADKDEIQAIRDELGEYQEKNDRFTNALSNYTGGLAGNQLPDGGSTGQILAKRSDMSGDAEWIDSSVSITIDDELSLESENPVQNKVITSSVIIKSDTLPTASEDLKGSIYQYSGETGVYTHGYIYECQEKTTYDARILIEPNKFVFDDTKGNLIDFFKEITPNYLQIATGIFEYDLAGNIWHISGKDSDGNTLFSNYNLYTGDLEDYGFVFIVPMSEISDGEQISYTLTYYPTTTYEWVRIDVQPNQSAEVASLENRVTSIESKIPAQASSSNQLADKNFVNSSIATNTATFRGTFNSVADLEAYSGEKDNNDYAFVTGTDQTGNTYYDRYKYNGISWVYEYRLNNSSFTSAQWASINSGATIQSINQISTNTANINSLQTSKQDTLVSGTSIKTINNQSLLGSGNIDIQGGSSYTSGTGIDINGSVISVDTSVIAQQSDIPTNNNQLTNGAGYITGITGSDVTTALGFTPYNATNPNGYQENVIESIKVNNTAQQITNKTVDITVPTTAADVSALPASTKYGANLTLSINSTTYVVTAQLKDQDGNNLGTAQTIDLPLESVVVSGSYDAETKKIILTLQSGSTVEFSVADLVSGLQSEITSTNKLDADLVDDSTSANKFVTAANKMTWNNKQDAISDLATIRSGAAKGATATQKMTATNPALTSTGGVCTWTISNTLATADVIVILKEVSTNDEVEASVTTTSSNVVIKMNSTSNISANTYKAVIVG